MINAKEKSAFCTLFSDKKLTSTAIVTLGLLYTKKSGTIGRFKTQGITIQKTLPFIYCVVSLSTNKPFTLL